MTRPARAIATALALLLSTTAAHALDTSARAALVIDHDTGTVLLSKNADTPMPPASMSKLMTLYMLFEALQDGRLALDDTFRVSERAWRMGGSKMFVNVGDEITVENLIRGIIIHSGNDACVVVAEGLAGSEEAFSQRMTVRARELGMLDSVFANSTGWPHPDHRMSARDLVTLATLLIREFPQYYPYFAETEFTWEGITQSNRNPLLGLGIGADGLKTGHTQEAGYGLVASGERDGRRVTLMVTGLDSEQARLTETERLMNWAFREFAVQELYGPDVPITNARVWLGAEREVPLVSKTGITAIVPWAAQNDIRAWVEYQGPLEAPVAAGQTVAELVLAVPEIGETRYPLQAMAPVPEAGFLRKVEAAATILFDKARTAAIGGDS
ncbi:D-alanyl-D-alanine carboxypeptidase [Halovulum dunhuangense]|uniref:serine-type D-Ala-D-Ala carboxypeptidase n=1 Tax=Halovulum dunhuangense TaxID=1505036 RepID=A0A849L291_9RHOB|nr:D-alanyl-D-alanine carboxypeptidase family protein [Halovulum dunhuangense]NNU80395.1 D-alanyl-D-alanine carboxypeptidase [Halovulum dunhuangense]